MLRWTIEPLVCVRLMPQIWLLALLLGFFAATPVAASEYQGKVVGVIDGDSIRVMHKGKPEQLRLLGIDCPEKRQPFGTRAKEYTSQLAFGQDVTVYGDKHDRYGRRLAEVLLPDGRSLNQELVKAGLAWWFRKYSKDLRLQELERQARTKKIGLWAEPHPVPPWEWREKRRSANSVARVER